MEPTDDDAPPRGKPGWMAIALITSFVFAAVGMFAIASRFVKRTPGPDVSTIAVIPFSDLGTAQAGASFARELADQISTTAGLHLTPATQAATLIEGRLETSGDRTRVAVWLVRASDRRALWSEHFEFMTTNPAAVETEIIRSVMNALHIQHATKPSAESRVFFFSSC